MKDIHAEDDCDSNSFYCEETKKKKPKGDNERPVFDQGEFRYAKRPPVVNVEAKKETRLARSDG